MANLVALSIILSWFFLWRTSFGAERSSLKPGEVVNHTIWLTSQNQRFYLKLEPLEQYSNLTYLFIGHRDMYTPTEDEEATNQGYRSWFANRNHPISNNSSSSNFTLDYSGSLTINLQNGRPLTLYSPPKSEVANNSNTILTLSDSGNLILQHLHPNGVTKQVLWQSFDHPSDILLPGMKLGVNHKTNRSWCVTASSSAASPASGSFTLEWDPRIKQLIIKRQGMIYWMSGVLKNKRFVNIPEQVQKLYEYSIVSTEEEDSFSFKSKYDDSQWVLFHNGRLLETRADDFLIASADACYGYNNGGGCQKWKLPKCRKPGEIFQVQFVHLDFPFGNGSFSVRDTNISISESDCKATCWTNCTCFGFKTLNYNGTGCIYYHGQWRSINVGSRDASTNILVRLSPDNSVHIGMATML